MTTPETTTPETPPRSRPTTSRSSAPGYVGVPLAQVFAEAGRAVVLVDVDAARVEQLLRGDSYIEDVPSESLAALVADRGLARDDGLRRRSATPTRS